MALYNIYLENDAPDIEIPDPEGRRKTWNDEQVLMDSEPTESNVLVKMVEGFVKDMIVDKFKSSKGAPKDELGLIFTINKKILSQILEQENCEGVRVILASSTGLNGALKTSIIVKPVDLNLTELDEVEGVSPVAKIMFTKSVTECPPKNICTKGVVNNFFKTFDNPNP